MHGHGDNYKKYMIFCFAAIPKACLATKSDRGAKKSNYSKKF